MEFLEHTYFLNRNLFCPFIKTGLVFFQDIETFFTLFKFRLLILENFRIIRVNVDFRRGQVLNDSYTVGFRTDKVTLMVSEGKARLFKNSQGRYLIYLPVDLAEDSMFPFKVDDSMHVHVSFKQGDKRLTIVEWKAQENKIKQ